MRKKKSKKGSIFQKLIASYVIFTLVALLGVVLCLTVSLCWVSGQKMTETFPYIKLQKDGTLEQEEATSFGGWIEYLDTDYRVVQIYGKKQTAQQSYTPEELLELTVGHGQGESGTPFHMYWQKAADGSYLIVYPRDAFSTVYNFDIGRVFVTNVGKAAQIVMLFLLLGDVLCVSYYISKKIRRPLDHLIQGMRRVANGEGQVVLSSVTEREFVEIQTTFNQMVEQLAWQKAENEKMNRSRHQMLLELSHDIRTPIATIKSYAYALSENMVSKELLGQYYQVIALKADRVNTMADDLFTMLKMESPDYSIRTELLDFAELVRRICVEYYEELTEAGFEPEVFIPERPIGVQADEAIMFRVVSNLLINAKKYNQSGHLIGVRLAEEIDYVVLCVEDDGQEIPKDIQNTMFTAFVRGEKARSTNGGTGLGLAIARAAIIKCGGEIQYERADGRNRFVVTLSRYEFTD